MKRQIGALLACTLMLSMGTTAFAQEPQTVVGTGENGETSIWPAPSGAIRSTLT